MSSSTLARLGAPAAAAALLALGVAAPASAHVTVTPSDTAAGAYTVLTFSVPHGCDGSPTSKVAISIPAGINAVTPTRNPFWDLVATSEKLDPPVTDAHGNELTERTGVVTYTTDRPLPEGQRDTFELSLQLPEDAAGQTLAFPVVQTCLDGETGWTEVAADGQSEDDLEHPAPSVTVTEAGDDGVAVSTVSQASGEPAPTEQASADDGGDGLAIAGLVVGAVGLVVGGVALARTRRERVAP